MIEVNNWGGGGLPIVPYYVYMDRFTWVMTKAS